MTARTLTATSMAFRDQRAGRCVLILLVLRAGLRRSLAASPTPSRRRKAGSAFRADVFVVTTMKELHGAGDGRHRDRLRRGLVGVFVMQSALQGDRRLVVAGFRPGETVSARLVVLVAATALVVAVSAIITASASPASWPPFLAAWSSIGLIYAPDRRSGRRRPRRLAATYLMLFFVDDRSRHRPEPDVPRDASRWRLAPAGYGPSRVMYDGAFSDTFHASGELVFGLGWLAALGIAVYVVLRRAVGQRVGPT